MNVYSNSLYAPRGDILQQYLDESNQRDWEALKSHPLESLRRRIPDFTLLKLHQWFFDQLTSIARTKNRELQGHWTGTGIGGEDVKAVIKSLTPAKEKNRSKTLEVLRIYTGALTEFLDGNHCAMGHTRLLLRKMERFINRHPLDAQSTVQGAEHWPYGRRPVEIRIHGNRNVVFNHPSGLIRIQGNSNRVDGNTRGARAVHRAAQQVPPGEVEEHVLQLRENQPGLNPNESRDQLL